MKSNSDGLMIDGIVGYIDRDNIDTDQIIPTEYLKSIKKFGFEDYLFDGWRYHDDGRLGIKKEEREINEDFILNKTPFNESKILLARDNFGCGSSREHAVWALRDFGFKAVIASSFGDIFYNNCFKNGILPIKLDEFEVTKLQKAAENSLSFTIDLENQKISYFDKNINHEVSFELDKAKKTSLLEGLDDIGLTLAKVNHISDFENKQKSRTPWLYSQQIK